MPSSRALLPHTRFLISFSVVLILGLIGFWAYYQAYGLPGLRFPMLSPLEEPSWEQLEAVSCETIEGEATELTDTQRPIFILVWVKADDPAAWEQWKHLASVADHPRMDLATVTLISDQPLDEMAAHAEKMGIPSSTDFRFVSTQTSTIQKVFSAELPKKKAATWVYLHHEPVFAQQGRMVPPREWLNLLQW